MSIKNFGEACKRIFESVKTLTGEVKVSTNGTLQEQIDDIVDGTKTANKATKWATARNINGMSVDGSANRANYGTCSTAAATVAKTVACTGFALTTGAEITVKFTVTNTASNPTLNVNNTGAKPIFYRGSAISAGYLATNRTYTFRYNGNQYELVGDINVDTDTTYSNFVKSGSGAKAGLVPAPPTTEGNAKYLREDGLWRNPSLDNTYIEKIDTFFVDNDTFLLRLGYLECTKQYDSLVLLISNSFYNDHQSSIDIISLCQDSNNDKINCTISISNLSKKHSSNTRANFYYDKDETNKRIYLYAQPGSAGNAYGKWSVSILQEAGGKWVSELSQWLTNQPKTDTLIKINENTISVENNAGFHNSIFRGKNLTNIYTIDEICERISSGTFEDLYVGDYFDAIISTPFTAGEVVRCVIAGFDIDYKNGNPELTKHHAVIVPKNCFSVHAKMNEEHETTGAYYNSIMHTSILPVYAAALQSALNNHILTYRNLLSNATSNEGVTTAHSWYDTTLALLSEVQVYGISVFGSHYDIGCETLQLPLFRLDPSFKISGSGGVGNGRMWWWLRNVRNTKQFSVVGYTGDTGYSDAGNSGGIRPYFLIG